MQLLSQGSQNIFLIGNPSITFFKTVYKRHTKFGAEYIIRGGENKIIEGSWEHPRTVVIRFPSYEKALEWYNSKEYEPIKKIRLENAQSNGIIIKGA